MTLWVGLEPESADLGKTGNALAFCIVLSATRASAAGLSKAQSKSHSNLTIKLNKPSPSVSQGQENKRGGVFI